MKVREKAVQSEQRHLLTKKSIIIVSGVNGGGAGGGSSDFRYGDECFYNKLSLLHFIIFFLLGGLTVLIVGAVQFKKEAGLSYYRYHFLITGAVLVVIGILLLVVKCACFRIPLPDEDLEEMDDLGHIKEAAEKIGGSGSKMASPCNVKQPPHLSVTITPAASNTTRKRASSLGPPGDPDEKQALTQSSSPHSGNGSSRRRSSTCSNTNHPASSTNVTPKKDQKKQQRNTLSPV